MREVKKPFLAAGIIAILFILAACETPPTDSSTPTPTSADDSAAKNDEAAVQEKGPNAVNVKQALIDGILSTYNLPPAKLAEIQSSLDDYAQEVENHNSSRSNKTFRMKEAGVSESDADNILNIASVGIKVGSTPTPSPTTTGGATGSSTPTPTPTPVPPPNPQAMAGLAVTVQTIPSGPVYLGTSLTFIATITNNGPATATGVVAQLTLAPSPFVSATATQGSCVLLSGQSTCSIGTLASGATAIVTYATITLAPGVTIVGTAEVGANEPDPDLANNSSMGIVVVIMPPP